MFQKNFCAAGARDIPAVHVFAFFFIPQNPGEASSVHEFAYHCVLKTAEYKHDWEYHSSAKNAEGDCYYNLRLSVLVLGCGSVGAFLVTYSLKITRKKIPTCSKKRPLFCRLGCSHACLLFFLASRAPGVVNMVHLVTCHCVLEAADTHLWAA